MTYWEKDRFLNFTLAWRHAGLHNSIIRHLRTKRHHVLTRTLRPDGPLLLQSIYSSDLQFHNELLNCDMPCVDSRCLVYVVRHASGGCLQMSKSLPACPIWSGSLLSFLGSAVWDLLWLACWLCGQAVQQTGLLQYKGTTPPKKSPRPGTLPQSADSAMPCTSEGSFVFIIFTEDFQEIHHCIWPYSVDIIKNSEHNKQPVYCLSLNTFVLASQNTLLTCGWNLHSEVLCPQQTRDMFRSRGTYGVAPWCLRFTEHVAHWASWLTCQYNSFKSYQRVMHSHIIGSVCTQNPYIVTHAPEMTHRGLQLIMTCLVVFLPEGLTASDKMRLRSWGRPNERKHSHKWNY